MAAGRAVGTLACRRGQPVLGVAIVGLTAPAASPFSWSHHWVWFAVLLAYLGYVGYIGGSRRARWSLERAQKFLAAGNFRCLDDLG